MRCGVRSPERALAECQYCFVGMAPANESPQAIGLVMVVPRDAAFYHLLSGAAAQRALAHFAETVEAGMAFNRFAVVLEQRAALLNGAPNLADFFADMTRPGQRPFAFSNKFTVKVPDPVATFFSLLREHELAA